MSMDDSRPIDRGTEWSYYEKGRWHTLIAGGGGGGGKAGGGDSGDTPTDDPDTLQSRSIARIIDILSEGPIEGWTHPDFPLLDIALDNTPIQNSNSTADGTDGAVSEGSDQFHSDAVEFAVFENQNGVIKPAKSPWVGRWINEVGHAHLPWGTTIKSVESKHSLTMSQPATAGGSNVAFEIGGSLNFKGFHFQFREGTQSQQMLSGFTAVEATHDAGNWHLTKNSDYIHIFTDKSLDACRIDATLPALQRIDPETGAHGSSVRLKIFLNGQNVIDDTITGKATSPYVRTYRISFANLPDQERTIVIKRWTNDSTDQWLQNDIYITSYTEITEGKLRYPNTALVGIRTNAKQFPTIPVRAYHPKGLLVRIPNNYNPVTREYTNEPWDGTLTNTLYYTDNPAWCFFDMCTNSRYGLGHLMTEANMDKFTLYDIGKYCDELVPDGKNGQEPRFTCNLYIQRHEDAIKVLLDMAGIFRGMLAYINGAITPIQDSPADASSYRMFSPANVIDGRFTYSGVGLRARHNVAIVSWSDINDTGKVKPEYVEDHESVAKSGGVNVLSLTGFGCTSRAQARRIGLWSIYAEKLLTDTVVFNTGLEGYFIKPGQVIQIQDPFRAGKVLSGRTLSGSTSTSLNLDRGITLESGATYTVALLDPANGQLVARNVTTASDGLPHSVITCDAFGFTPEPESVFQLAKITSATGELKPELFRVLALGIKDKATLEITALKYNASLYDFVDFDYPLEEPPISELPPSGGCLPPSNLLMEVIQVVRPDHTIQQDIELKWLASPDPFLSRYRPTFRYDQGNWEGIYGLWDTDINGWRVSNAVPGTWEFAIYAINSVGAKSDPLFGEIVVEPPPTNVTGVAGLEIFGGNVYENGRAIFQTPDCHFVWRASSEVIKLSPWDGTLATGAQSELAAEFDVRILCDNYVLWQDRTTTSEYTFTIDRNRQAAENIWGAGAPPLRIFTIEVRVVFIDDTLSDPARLEVENPLPPEPTDVITLFGNGYVAFQWTAADAPDIANYALFASLEHDDDNPPKVADFGLATSGIYYPPSTETRYYWLGSVDTFGNVSSNVPQGPPPGSLVLPPRFEPPVGRYQGETTVRIYLDTEGCQLYVALVPRGQFPTEFLVMTPATAIVLPTGEYSLFAIARSILPPHPAAITYGDYLIASSYTNTPAFSPAPGFYELPFMTTKAIAFGSTTSGAYLYYTTDGTNPAHDANGNPTGTTIKVNRNILTQYLRDGVYNFRVLAWKPGLSDSSITEGSYVLVESLGAPCDTPTFNPPAGRYDFPLTVQINSANPSASLIRYTTNGQIPSRDGPGAVTANHSSIVLSGPCFLKAVAYTRMNAESAVAIAQYSSMPRPLPPTLQPGAGMYSTFPMNVNAFVPAQDGARIRYTLDGSQPSLTHGTFVGAKTPDQVAGVKVWLNADALALSDGARVALWGDASGHNNDVSQATAGLRPTFVRGVLNSKSIVRFNGSSLASTGSIGATAPNTIIVVAKQSSKATNARFIDSAIGNRQLIDLDTSGHFSMYAGGTGIADVIDHSGAFHIFSARYDGASSKGFVDNVQVLTGNPGSQLLGQLFVGSDGGSTFLTGDIAQVIIGTFSDADRIAIESYFANYYALAGCCYNVLNEGVVVIPSAGTTLRALTYNENGGQPSDIVTALYSGFIQPPGHTPESRFYDTGEELAVVIDGTEPEPQVSIQGRYTLDGTIPSRTNGILISSFPQEITISGGYRELRSIAFPTDANAPYNNSQVKLSTYDWGKPPTV